MTHCTICGETCRGDDQANEAWCRWCFEHYVVQAEDRREARRLAAEVEQRLAACRLAPPLRRA